jgi:hypothetical protein
MFAREGEEVWSRKIYLTTPEPRIKIIVLRRLYNEKNDSIGYSYDDYFYCFWAGKK